MKKILDFIEKLLLFVLGLLMTAMVAVIFMQVVLRYSFHSATNWADEFARYCMIWVVFLACPVGYRRHSHIRIDVLTRCLPHRAQRALELAMYILQIVFLAVVLTAGLEYIDSIQNQNSLALKVNMQYVHMGTVIGAGLMIVFILERIGTDYVLPLVRKRKGDAA